jgi:hypothetical protein
MKPLKLLKNKCNIKSQKIMCTKRLGYITFLSQLQEEVHIGQNDHSVRKHFGKNISHFKNNNKQSTYAPQIL